MEQTKSKTNSRATKKIRRKKSKLQKSNLEAIFKAVDELHKAGVDLSYLQQ